MAGTEGVERQKETDWERHFFAKVREGIAAADNGDFASDEEVRAVRDKYRPKRRPSFSP